MCVPVKVYASLRHENEFQLIKTVFHLIRVVLGYLDISWLMWMYVHVFCCILNTLDVLYT